MANKLNGNVKWISLALTLIVMVFVFGQRSKALEKDDEANATAITVVREQHDKDMRLFRDDVKEIKNDVKALLSRP